MANLIVDIGNTVLKAAWCDGITLGKTYRYQGEKMFDFILSLAEKNRPEVLVLSSVRFFSESNIHSLKQVCEHLIVFDQNMYEKYGIPSYLTSDRAASIIASRHLFKDKGCIIFDFGTTLSIDMLDEKGVYEGGNISLGYRVRFKSLNRYSKSLPLVNSTENILEKGSDVKSSIESGVVSGIIFEIEGYMSRYPGKISLFTGGDSIYFAKRMKNSIFVVCNLVLIGLALIAVEYDQKD